MSYTSYERVSLALNHQEPDRVPLDLGGTMVSGINVNALRNLRKHLGMPPEATIRDKVTQMADTGEDMVQKLGIDIENVSPAPASTPGLTQDLGLVDSHFRLIDEFGMGWQMPQTGGLYYDLYLSPLQGALTPRDIASYPWPDPLDPARFAQLKVQAEHIVHQKKRAYVLGRMSAGMWETAMWMTGYEKFYCDMLLNRKLVQTLMEKLLELKMQYWKKALETVGQNVMIVSTADDLGTQNSLLVSLDLYKELIWPYHKRLFTFIKKHAQSKVFIFFHSCGAVREAIPLLIEAGVDILNPVQVNCAGMQDTKALKKEFGDVLTFWGGSCDTQHILPFGTPEQVRDETRRRIDDLAPGGGFVFAPIHVIQGEVPPQNILAWWETLREYGAY
jgi:uroporphyrinogen decarboxylase